MALVGAVNGNQRRKAEIHCSARWRGRLLAAWSTGPPEPWPLPMRAWPITCAMRAHSGRDRRGGGSGHPRPRQRGRPLADHLDASAPIAVSNDPSRRGTMAVEVPAPLGNLNASKEISYVMSQNPTCPNCGRAMTLRRTTVNASPAEDDNVFQCPSCKLVYLTPDHVPTSGQAAK
jgi:ribosomal protein L37AE/L43A